MRLLYVGLVSAALLASTSMVMAQSTNTYRYHRQHHIARNADVPYGYQGSVGGTEGFHGAAHNGAGLQQNPPAPKMDMKMLPGATEETNRWFEWSVHR
jgi:hypothetical protein